MRHAQTAIKLKPERAEGHYYHAWAVGQWSLGISIPKALWKGAEGKLRRSMKKAQALSAGYDDHGVLRMWGRFFHSLPWPKYDGAKALNYLQDGTRRSPSNLRGWFYLAEAQIGLKKHAAACATVARPEGQGAATSWSRTGRSGVGTWCSTKSGQCRKTLEAL